MQITKFEKFFQRANFFYKSVGVEAYKDTFSSKAPAWLGFVLYSNMLNLNFCLVTEMMSAYLAIQNGDFIDVPMLLTYMGFISLCNIKIGSIACNKSKTSQLMRDLRKLYETEKTNLSSHDTQALFTSYDRLAVCHIIAFMALMWVYNMYPLVHYLIHIDELEPVLPYGWMPPNWKHSWPFYIFYASNCLAGYTSAVGQVANDLMLCALATQLIMHYRHLAGLIEAQEGNELGMAKRSAFLKYVIQYHQELLSISQTVNSVFGVSLLLNFMSSSLMVCFLGFLMTVGAETFVLIKLFLFFFCSLLQIYMICKCAQELIDSSESVGHAVYNHNWTSYVDLRNRKMLTIMIQRAQKPAILQATSFVNISFVTMTDLLQLSYKFFALLRTLYSG